ncbi:penicillin-binding protein activator [bacterium]|nr:penicillin-binding protein activator [bacterium]
MKIYNKIIFLFIITICVLHAQETQLIDSLFYRGVNTYQAGQFQGALQQFEFMDRVYPGHRRSTGSLLMQGKALNRMGEHQRAIEAFNELVMDHPSSSYVDDALYGKAVAFYQLGANEDAVRVLFQLLDRGGDTRLMHKAANLSSDLMDFRLDINGLKQLHETVHDERGQAAITLRLVQRLIKNEQYQQCKDLLNGFLEKFPQSMYIVEIQQKLRQVNMLARGSVKLGVILPLSGELAEQGKAVLSGIKYAVDMHNSKDLTKVELIVEDTQGEILTAIKAAQSLCEDEGVVAVIGELESDQTAAVAAVTQERQVPLLSPTASALGIAEVGSYVFQLNPPLNVRAKMLADYAVSGLGLKKFAVLAEAGEYGRVMHDAFKRHVIELGGDILIEKWYYSGDEHLGVQFKTIREFGLRKMLDDSVLIRVPKNQLDKQRRIPGVQFVDRGVEDLVDSTALTVTAFQGMFLPVLHEDLQYIIPQFAKYNFSAKVLGGVPWNDVELLIDHSRFIDSRYLEGLVFLSDFFADPSDYQYNQFMTDYRLTMRRSPDKLDVFGYDAASILLSLVEEGHPGRERLAKRLGQVRDFKGIQGPISFESERVNTSIHLMQFRGGKIIPIR